MATFRSGVSTRGLSETTPPQFAYARRQNAGEYIVDVSLSAGGRLELITNAQTFHHLISHMREVGKYIDKDASEWNRDLIELEGLARRGIDLRGLNHGQLHVLHSTGSNGANGPKAS